MPSHGRQSAAKTGINNHVINPNKGGLEKYFKRMF
jgi:hypothetical protein